MIVKHQIEAIVDRLGYDPEYSVDQAAYQIFRLTYIINKEDMEAIKIIVLEKIENHQSFCEAYLEGRPCAEFDRYADLLKTLSLHSGIDVRSVFPESRIDNFFWRILMYIKRKSARIARVTMSNPESPEKTKSLWVKLLEILGIIATIITILSYLSSK
jgi:hypothetical protein